MGKHVVIAPASPEHAKSAEIMDAIVNMALDDPAVRDQLLRDAADIALRESFDTGDPVEPPPL